MDRIIFSGEWKDILAEKGYKTFNDLYYKIKKRRIGCSRDHNRTVSTVSLQTNEGEKTLFIKRFRHAYLKDKIFIFLNTGKFLSQAGYEWDNINLLAQKGIKAPKTVCYGEYSRLGFLRRSFIITEEINGQCLTDFISQNWNAMPNYEKEKIIISLAKTIKKIHNAKFSLKDLYLWHIYIHQNGNNEYDFIFLDFNRMRRNVGDKNEFIKNLGRLHYSMIDQYFDNKLKQLLINTYGEGMNNRDMENLTRKIKKYSKKYLARRGTKNY